MHSHLLNVLTVQLGAIVFQLYGVELHYSKISGLKISNVWICTGLN